MVENKDNQKFYTKWWFWVVVGFIFIFVIIAIMPYPSCEETEKELMECKQDMSKLLDVFNEYDKALENYCEIDDTNPLCDTLFP